MYLTDPPQSLWLLSPPMVLSSGPFLMSSPQTCSGREDIRNSPPLDCGGTPFASGAEDQVSIKLSPLPWTNQAVNPCSVGAVKTHYSGMDEPWMGMAKHG